MKLYTKSGDTGYTKLGDTTAIAKCDARIEAIGNIDELLAFLDFAILDFPEVQYANLTKQLRHVCQELQQIMGMLAQCASSPLPTSALTRLEKEIDAMNTVTKIEPKFLVNTGNKKVALLQICRTICRRAERSLAKLTTEFAVTTEVLAYMNRLSDWLFMSALHVRDLCTKNKND